MLDLTLLVVVVVVVISGGTAMFFYTSFQKGLIIFYSLDQEFCLFFVYQGSNRVQVSDESEEKVRDGYLSAVSSSPSRRLGRYIMLTTTQETAWTALS